MMKRATSKVPGEWIDAVTARFRGRTGAEPSGTKSQPSGDHLVGAFARLFGETGSMEVRRVSLCAINAASLPCVLVLKDGTGLSLLERASDDRFRVLTAKGQSWFAAGELAEWHAGTIVVLAGRPNQIVQPIVVPLDGQTSVVAEIARATIASRLLPQLLIAAALSNLFIFALPLYSMIIYDRIIPHKALETLWALTGGLVIVFMVDLFCKSMRSRIVETIGIGVSMRLQQALFGRMLAAELAHANRKSGVLSSALGALDSACLIAPALIVGVIADLPFTLLILIYVVSIAHWVVVAPLLALLCIVAISLVAHVAGRAAFKASARCAIHRTALIEEGARTLEIVKSVGGERHAQGRWAQMLDGVLFHAHVGRHASTVASQAANTVLQGGTMLSLVIGVFLINNGEMTVGALSSAVMLTSRSVSPVSSLCSMIVKALSLTESLAHVSSLRKLALEEIGDDARTPARLEGQIRFSQVGFRYPKEAKPALNEISFSIAPGERVGLIGRIGSGKSTLAHLIPRLYTPDTGNVLVDEHDLRQYDPVWLRRHIAFMPQDCELLEASIRDNIVRGLDEVDEDAFARAVHASGVKDFIAGHPAGYGMNVGPTGRRLSGGERQAVCLARTLVRDASVLVLDEPTSSMDSQLETQIIERMKSVVQGRTVIIATHRAPLLQLVERIIWLDGGRIIADGPSTEVLRQAARAAA